MADGAGRPSADEATRVVLRPIANPFALGFVGLAGATVTLAGLELGWIPSSESGQVGLILLAIAPVLQLVACAFGFLARDALAATGMGTLAGTWACVGGVQLLAAGGRSDALGTLLFVGAAAVGLTALGAAQTKLVPAAVMGGTSVRFGLSGAFQVTGERAWADAAGIVGLALGALALYAALSLELEDVKGRTVLPTLRRGRGREVIAGDLAAQVKRLPNEAGVREQL